MDFMSDSNEIHRRFITFNVIDDFNHQIKLQKNNSSLITFINDND